MANYADYRIMPGLKLILECCKGQATVEDAIQMKKAEISDELYNSEYDIFVDFHQFETFLDQKVHDHTSEFFNFLSTLDLKGRIAMFTAEPVQVVVGVMLKDLFSIPGSPHIGVFSTMNAAIKHLGIPAGDIDRVSKAIKALNKSINVKPNDI